MPYELHRYTREHLGEVIERLRESPAEFNRIKSSLSANHARTLVRDIQGGWERRFPGRKIDPDYMHSVCILYLNRFSSEIYNSIINIVGDDSSALVALDNMIGKYKAYWPSGEEGNFDSFQLEIGKSDGTYWVSTVTKDAEHEYNHFGYAFLIRRRVHVVAVRKYGIRTMLFHYEDVPARYPPRGIIMNVLHSEDAARTGEQLYAAHFLAIHQQDPRFHERISNDEIARMLRHDRNRVGVIRA
jgi:hypothetical protein